MVPHTLPPPLPTGKYTPIRTNNSTIVGALLLVQDKCNGTINEFSVVDNGDDGVGVDVEAQQSMPPNTQHSMRNLHSENDKVRKWLSHSHGGEPQQESPDPWQEFQQSMQKLNGPDVAAGDA